MNDMAGRVVAITGASSGIGAAAARTLVGAGAKVVLGARRTERIADLAGELGDSARAVTTDVRDPADAQRLVDTAVEAFGRLDALIANAGIGMYGGIMDRTDDELKEMLDTNVAGTVWPVRAAVPRLRENGGGDIVIVSSVAGLRGRGVEAVYAATKHAQMGLAGGLDRELHREGIRVTALCPGGVVTEFAMGRGRTDESPELADMMTADDVAEAIRWVLGQPSKVRTLVYSLRGTTEED
ncbi:SDR family oxidoreductase [Jiangella asiatica]|uniref:SDR family oxidoreductase n=1 Tax=Jiangella asiatica TaxID=2530372 RepID=A0A4R5CYR5_9ACTN|nr:SDR family oxidoreductase [Jiangella asiatica]TDE03115.1 SDR family oxidoreductase [Jiangella asiatica]